LCCSTAGSQQSLTILAQVARGEDVKSLIAEAEETRSTAEERQRSAHAKALDPVAGAAAASAAKLETDNLRFEVERLSAALEALHTAHAEAKARELDRLRHAAYDKAKAERDALTAEVCNLFPQIEKQLTDLMKRIAPSMTQPWPTSTGSCPPERTGSRASMRLLVDAQPGC